MGINVKKFSWIFVLFFIGAFLAHGTIPTPVIKWQKGGFVWGDYNKYRWTAPVLLDVNDDGQLDVIFAGVNVFAFDGNTGAVLWRFYAGTDRANPNFNRNIETHTSVAMGDLDGDGEQEFVTVHQGGWVCAYEKNGYFMSGFPVRPEGRTDYIESVSLYDIDGNGDLEIIIGWGKANNLNCCVIEHNGATRSGWPQYQPNENFNALGIFNQNIAVADTDGDGSAEIFVPSDTGKICAYYPNGSPLPTNQIFQNQDPWGPDPMDTWPKVVNYEDYEDEKYGYAPDGVGTHFWMGTDYPATIADVNNDGVFEMVVVPSLFTKTPPDYQELYSRPFIYNIDRTRFNDDGFNWTTNNVPVTGPPLYPLEDDWSTIARKTQNPVVVDIDGDGNKEILSSTYDGKVHCWWLDKTEKHNWPFSVYTPGANPQTFASEPTVADLDNDGQFEVIFTTWPKYHTFQTGHLYILNHEAEILQKKQLPYGYNGEVGDLEFDGGLAAPTVDDLDGDGDPEILVGMVYGGMVVYTLPGIQMGSAPWPTGRHDFSRTGWDGYGFFTLTSPNGGESLEAGFAHNITWNAAGISGLVKIEYSSDNGDQWTTLSSGAPNTGSYIWTVPDIDAAECLVRIGKPDGSLSDMSGDVFSIFTNPPAQHDSGHAVIETNDGGYLVAGSTNSYGSGGYDMVLYKLDANGNKWWRKTYGGDQDDFAWCLQPTEDGNVILGGYTESYTHGGTDFLLFKLDSTGKKVWRKNLGGDGDDDCYGVRQIPGGGYIVIGSTQSYSKGLTDFLVYKLSEGGSKVWRKNLGGDAADYGYAVWPTRDGGFAALGHSAAYTNGGEDMLLYKLDYRGAKEWRKNYGGDGDEFVFGSQAVQQTTDGGYVIGGYSDSYTHGGADFMVYKLNAAGSKVWRKNYGGDGDEQGVCVQQTSDGGYLVSGYTTSYTNGGYDFLSYKVNGAGQKVWRRSLGGEEDDVLYAAIQLSDGGYAVVGETFSYSATPDYTDILFYKLKPTGIKSMRLNF